MAESMIYGSGSSKSRAPQSVFMQLLWTNPAPTSTFSPQNVSVDLSGYKMFGVTAIFQTSIPWQVPMQIYAVDDQTKGIYINSYSSKTGIRSFTYSEANKHIAFAKATYDSSDNNNMAIPYQIYGIKGIT